MGIEMETAWEREALLPCPFCGGQPRHHQNAFAELPHFLGCHNVDCNAAPYVEAETVEQCVADWNLRSSPPIAPGEREALIARVRKYAAEDDFIDRDGRPNTTNRATGIRELANLLEKSIAAKAQAPAEPAGFDRTTALLLLSAASKSGNEGAIRFAAQLAGAAQCHGCGYVNFHCRCAAPKAPAENTSATPVDKTNASEQLRYFAEAARFDRSVFQDDTAFADWVQSRCRHLLAKLAEAGKEPAQPAES